jgi:hypothetical protein
MSVVWDCPVAAQRGFSEPQKRNPALQKRVSGFQKGLAVGQRSNSGAQKKISGRKWRVRVPVAASVHAALPVAAEALTEKSNVRLAGMVCARWGGDGGGRRN